MSPFEPEVERLFQAMKRAAGGAHTLFVGPKGCGKTMLARRLPIVMPRMSPVERAHLERVYATAGLTKTLPKHRRPFRAPHHTVSRMGLVGGLRFAYSDEQAREVCVVQPGECSLAHGGILFLDEIDEFSRTTLMALAEPMNTAEVCLTGKAGRWVMAAGFTLVGTCQDLGFLKRGGPGLQFLRDKLTNICTLPDLAASASPAATLVRHLDRLAAYEKED